MSLQLMQAQRMPGQRGAMSQALGQGGQAYMQTVGQARDAAARRELESLKLNQFKRSIADEEALRSLAPKYFTPGSPGSTGTDLVEGALGSGLGYQGMAPTAPKFDMQGYAQAVMGVDPSKGIPLMQSLQKESQFNKIDPKDFTPQSLAKFAMTKNYGDLEPRSKLHFADTGGTIQGVDEYTGRPVAQLPKSGNPFSDLVLSDGQGGFRQNAPLLGAKQSVAKAGAPVTSIRVENKMGDSLAKEIGPIMGDSAIAATGAAQQIDAAQRIVKAVDTNKIFAGPGASIRLKGAQIGDLLGVGGADAQEKIANTRSTIRGLAEMTLQGRKQMRGQGAITESESKLAERAISGDIDDLTAAEIKQLAKASERSARFVHAQHQNKLNVVRNNPNMAPLAPFYESQPLPEAPPPSAPTATYIWKDGKLVPVQ